MIFDVQLIISSLPELFSASLLSVELAFISAFCGMLLAGPLALFGISRWRILQGFARGYIFFFRGTPLLVQIFLVYYGSGQFVEFFERMHLWSILREPYWCALLALSLNTAAYTAELLRGSIENLPKGEIEAAKSMGMSHWLLMRRIVLPKAIRLMLPAYGNEVILLFKATSLVSTITMMDLMGVTRDIISRTYAPIELFVAAGIVYACLTYLFVACFRLIEKHFNRHLHPQIA